MPQFIFAIILAIISLIFDPSIYRRRGYRLGSYESVEFTPARWIQNYIERRNRRINALKTAAPFIKPYEKLFGNHVLSNKHCAISLNHKKQQMTCLSSEYNNNGKKMMLIANHFSGMDIDEYFDMMCGIFNYNLTYEVICKSVQTVAIVHETVYSSKPVENPTFIKKESEVVQQEYIPQKSDVVDIKQYKNQKNEKDNSLDITEKIDVNSASEAELTALPGINVIAAKKIINYRETNRPFKSVEDFFEVMRVKPHFANQLKSMICANKINMKKCKKAKSERIIDL